MTFWKGWINGMHVFGKTIALIVNTLLLCIVYVLGVGITALIAKLMKKHFLQKESGWSELNLKKEPLENYYRQF